MATLDEATRGKIDAVLERVKEPQSMLSVRDLNLVSRLTYSEKERTLVVVMNIGTPRFQCPACSAINGVVKAGVERMLDEEFRKEFPGFTIRFE